MNKVLLIGRVVKDAELKVIESSGTTYTRFLIAVDKVHSKEKVENTADFLQVVLWKEYAEALTKYLNKGKLISVIGRLNTSNYQGKDGIKRYSVEVMAEEIKFLDNKNSNLKEEAV